MWVQARYASSPNAGQLSLKLKGLDVVMPSDATTTEGRQDLWRMIDELKRELSDAHRREAATAEVLKVISSSPTDVQAVFDTIVRSAVLLCGAMCGARAVRFDGELMHLVARYNSTPEVDRALREVFPMPMRPSPRTMAGRAILSRDVVQVEDALEDPDYQKDVAQAGGFRSMLAAPMLRDGHPIGAIVVNRRELGLFSSTQVQLLRTFADQAVIGIENARLFEEVQKKNYALTEANAEVRAALERETASSEILRVIGSSPTDVQPVFEAIARSGVSVCGAFGCVVLVVDGTTIRVAATHGVRPERLERFRRDYPMHLSAEIDTAQTIRHRRMFHLADIENNPNATADDIENARLAGYRTRLMVPMVRGDRTLGLIAVTREDPTPFPDQLVELLRTFADQAVIAIENARLFEAEQASKRELTEALEQQTATADVLKAISRSAFDVQKVLDTLIEAAVKLTGAKTGILRRREGDVYPLVASFGLKPEWHELIGQLANAPGRDTLVGRVTLEGRTVQIPDVFADPDFSNVEAARIIGFRANIGTPLHRDGQMIGYMAFQKETVGPFGTRQVELIETFANQAVIAIENTRLFEAEQARTKELQVRSAELSQSLEYQTAISNVLSVISRSPNQLQPVLDEIARTAANLCEASNSVISLEQGGELHLVAAHGLITKLEKGQIDRGWESGRAYIDRKPVHVHDMMAARDEFPLGYELGQRSGHRTTLGIPLLREGKAIGCLFLRRTVLKPFSEKQIALLQTFADQAVIAIENTRLFEAEQASKRELTEALEQQTATADVLKVISRSVLDVQKVLDALVESAARLCNAYDAAIFQVFGDSLRLVAHNGQIPFAGPVGQYTMPLVRGRVPGRAVIDRRTIHITDMLTEANEYPESQRRALQQGWRTGLAVPLVHAGEAMGVILIRRAEVRQFTERQIELVNTFADQAVIAIENTRLFEEVQARTRELAKTVEELEIASQHKSQFVANMSHELRTPLAAILGYAELIQEGFYEPQGPKSLDALTRIRSNGKHLLGLINTVLDIAKIESGQFSLNLAEYALENVVETVRAATEALAETKKLGLKTEVAKRLPIGVGDEQRLTQVLLNLVGNAIKFTDAGEVRIIATASNGHFALSVTDTGPGIPQEHQARIFEQFHQVDSSNTKAKGGTGLGLSIAKQIVEMHGGRIWVESTLGKGSTFRMEIPTRAATT